MTEQAYEYHSTEKGGAVKAWTKGVPFADNAREQALRISELPFIHRHVAVMPDVHLGIGATVGSVIATKKAIVPALVGVDLGCGMVAQETTLDASLLPDTLAPTRSAIEKAVPVGRASFKGKPGPAIAAKAMHELARGLAYITGPYDNRHPLARASANAPKQLGTLGGGNHFIELCVDEEDRVWVMLHSGSRGIGNVIGRHFIEMARKDMERHFIQLPDRDLAYFVEGTSHFDEYVSAMEWAQAYAWANREVMLKLVLRAMQETLPPFQLARKAINCHHNYAERENHFGENVWVTRKGAVRARKGDLGIIPGSMGARSHIVEGLGNPESFHSCSHGAGRTMSRTEAKRTFTVDDHKAATEGVECRKDEGVIDETPGAYKSIDAVMAAQSDLVRIVRTLKQVVCVKG